MAKLDVALDPKTGNPVMRTTPEYKIKRVYAHNANVVIVGSVGGQDTERVVDRKEAIARAQALSEMSKKQSGSDFDETLTLVEMFVEAIKKAKENSGKPYKAISVSMTGSGFKQGASAK